MHSPWTGPVHSIDWTVKWYIFILANKARVRECSNLPTCCCWCCGICIGGCIDDGEAAPTTLLLHPNVVITCMLFFLTVKYKKKSLHRYDNYQQPLVWIFSETKSIYGGYYLASLISSFFGLFEKKRMYEKLKANDSKLKVFSDFFPQSAARSI